MGGIINRQALSISDLIANRIPNLESWMKSYAEDIKENKESIIPVIKKEIEDIKGYNTDRATKTEEAITKLTEELQQLRLEFNKLQQQLDKQMKEDKDNNNNDSGALLNRDTIQDILDYADFVNNKKRRR